MLGMNIMKSHKSIIFDIIMYIAISIFCIYWMLEENISSLYIYSYSIIIATIIIFKINSFIKTNN